MIQPKTPKDLYEIVSEKTGVSKEDVEKLSKCFYEEWVPMHLESFENSGLVIDYFGLFYFRRQHVKKAITTIEALQVRIQKDLEKDEVRVNKIHPRIVAIWKRSLKDLSTLTQRILNLQNLLKK